MQQHFERDITRLLSYYEIFAHPLSLSELYYLFPSENGSLENFRADIERLASNGQLVRDGAYFHLPGAGQPLGKLRSRKSQLGRRRMRVALFIAQIMKRFPFVRGVLLSGDVSKGVATQKSDIDYVIVTANGRLWICRMLLIAFKKIVLLNRRTYFCLNYFVSEDALTSDDRDYYTATEIAHLKPLFNEALYFQYMNSNAWIRKFFPQFDCNALVDHRTRNRRSIVQRFAESMLKGRLFDRLDFNLMIMMRRHWARKYRDIPEQKRETLFRSTPGESRAYAGDFSDPILKSYSEKLSKYGVA